MLLTFLILALVVNGKKPKNNKKPKHDKKPKQKDDTMCGPDKWWCNHKDTCLMKSLQCCPMEKDSFENCRCFDSMEYCDKRQQSK